MPCETNGRRLFDSSGGNFHGIAGDFRIGRNKFSVRAGNREPDQRLAVLASRPPSAWSNVSTALFPSIFVFLKTGPRQTTFFFAVGFVERQQRETMAPGAHSAGILGEVESAVRSHVRRVLGAVRRSVAPQAQRYIFSNALTPECRRDRRTGRHRWRWCPCKWSCQPGRGCSSPAAGTPVALRGRRRAPGSRTGS